MTLALSSHRAAFSSSSAPVGLPDQVATTLPALSCKASSEVFPATLPCDPHRFRALFPGLWTSFLRAHFRDAMHAAYSLGVTERAARDWFEGKTGANGAAALYAVGTVPGAMDWIINAARKAA